MNAVCTVDEVKKLMRNMDAKLSRKPSPPLHPSPQVNVTGSHGGRERVEGGVRPANGGRG